MNFSKKPVAFSSETEQVAIVISLVFSLDVPPFRNS